MLARARTQRALVRDYTSIHSLKRGHLVKLARRSLPYPVVLPHLCFSVAFVRSHDWNCTLHQY